MRKYDRVAEEQQSILENWQEIQIKIGHLHPTWLDPVKKGLFRVTEGRDILIQERGE